VSVYPYEAVTEGVVVRVAPHFLPEQSVPDESRFVWAYSVEIENTSQETVQLVSRFWRILDKFGREQEVRGPGVVGEQPILQPGDSFTYTSGCPLSAPSGVMMGTYQMRRADGTGFDAEVPAFSLDSPYDRRAAN
jgi:ApaG protein